jgi:hypothetical protein
LPDIDSTGFDFNPADPRARIRRAQPLLRIALVDGWVVFRPRTPQIEVQLRDISEVIRDFAASLERFMTREDALDLMTPLYRQFIAMLLARAGMDTDAPNEVRPPNADFMPEAGETVVKTVRTVPDAAAMKIDPQALETDLAEAKVRRELFKQVSGTPEVVRRNLAHTEQRVATTIKRGINRVRGDLPTNAWLAGSLESATKWAAKSAEEAKETLKDHARVADQVRREVAAETAGSGSPPVTGPVAGSGTPGPGTPPAGGTPPGTLPGRGGASAQPLPRPRRRSRSRPR